MINILRDFWRIFGKCPGGKFPPTQNISPEEISPGELSGIFRKTTLVYSREFAFF
jgi:hypothetical protein